MKVGGIVSCKTCARQCMSYNCLFLSARLRRAMYTAAHTHPHRTSSKVNALPEHTYGVHTFGGDTLLWKCVMKFEFSSDLQALMCNHVSNMSIKSSKIRYGFRRMSQLCVNWCFDMKFDLQNGFCAKPKVIENEISNGHHSITCDISMTFLDMCQIITIFTLGSIWCFF